MEEERLNTPAGEPLMDTWELYDGAGAWYIAAAPDAFTSSADWYRTALRASLDAFGGLLRVWRVEIETLTPPAPDADYLLSRRADEAYADFIGRLFGALNAYRGEIFSLVVHTECNAYAATIDAPDRPMRRWLSLPADFLLKAATGGKAGYACFELHHTLFCPYSSFGQDNRALFQLNHPLLEHALRAWEAELGPIDQFEGMQEIFRYGFTADAP